LEPDLEEILRDAAETEFPRCDPGGVPWDGRHEDCLYEVDLCCYGTPDEACRAARCAYHACSIVETAPAQILCEKGDNGAQRSARE
jgi:hypothetical protein